MILMMLLLVILAAISISSGTPLRDRDNSNQQNGIELLRLLKRLNQDSIDQPLQQQTHEIFRKSIHPQQGQSFQKFRQSAQQSPQKSQSTQQLHQMLSGPLEPLSQIIQQLLLPAAHVQQKTPSTQHLKQSPKQQTSLHQTKNLKVNNPQQQLNQQIPPQTVQKASQKSPSQAVHLFLICALVFVVSFSEAEKSTLRFKIPKAVVDFIKSMQSSPDMTARVRSGRQVRNVHL